MLTFESLKSEYEDLWSSMKIRPDRAAAVDTIARKLVANKARYQAAERSTGVPWFVIAAWHNRESDANFSTQLAQGDPLNRRSVNVPSGRGPFDTWEEGAKDALVTLKHLDQIKDWSPARISYETESYNGFGYRNNHPDVKSPYLWSFSNHYSSGKYVADGQFSSGAVDKQCGAIPVMKTLMAIGGSQVVAPVDNDQEDDDTDDDDEIKNSRGGWLSALLAFIMALFHRAPTKPTEAPVTPAPPHPASVEPPWMRWAAKEVGFHETGTNRNIGRYTGPAKCGSEGDPWCAIFVNAGLESNGVRGTRSAMARSFEHNENFVKLDGPAFGAITTMWRGSPSSGSGHVFFYSGENDRGILALGGNQSDQVCRQYEPRNRVVGYWWPKTVPLPKTGKVFISGAVDGDANEGSEA